MADPRWRMKFLKNHVFQVEFFIAGFFGSLFMNLNLHFENFGIQNGGSKMANEIFEKSSISGQIFYGGVFWVAVYESEVTF